MMGKRLPGTAERASGTPPSEEVTVMLHPSGPDAETPLAVRDGASAPVTCASCGCRLAQTGEAWFHFNPIAGRDARGCRVACADAAHDSSGRAVSIAV
ncbi:MAG TPA: hypothetical protein VFN41_00595 [Candidatus Limnocylindrales bacterium]|nr:hypothetical protein [Candidatus Limnocylindrales bacterium]